MPLYKFMCPRGHTTEEFKPVSEFVDNILCYCGEDASICFPTRTYAQTFKPFKTDGITGQEVEITSKHQRDRLLKKHNLTMDTNRYHKRKIAKPAVEGLTFGEVKAAIERGRDNEGNKIQGTVESADSID